MATKRRSRDGAKPPAQKNIVEPSTNNQDRARRLIEVMAGMGMDRQATAVLADLAELDLGDADQQHWLHGPLVVHASPWNDTLPKWMHVQAMAERWKIINGELPDHVVGPTEIACVMYGGTLDAPLRSDAADMYLWATRHAITTHYGEDSEQAATARELSERVTDDDVLRPNGRLYYNYRDLTAEIRRKVANARRAELKGTRAKKLKPPVKAEEPEPQVVETAAYREQGSLF